ncbi:PRD domain-containing protein [Vibrio rumoiensis]|uniref:PRD domain-containing protein n=1 Tax=Vibrio rumoiensis TaxID=76258 RepID=UPI0013A5AD03|nr:PRD domain-containing protein [Vibrio rumoiensis]
MSQFGVEFGYIHQVLSTTINDIQYYSEVRFTDKDRKLLTSLLYVFISRVIKGNISSMSPEQKEFIQCQVDIDTISTVVDQLSKALKLSITGNEYYYVALLATVLKSERNLSHSLEFDQKLHDCVEKMIVSFEKLSGLYFSRRNQLHSQLISHLRPAIVRAFFGIKIANILKEEVYHNYPLIMDTVKVVVMQLEGEFNITLDEDELCYISMNFASHVSGEDTESTKEKRILLITEGGKSSTRLLESQILGLSIFPLIIENISASEINEQLNISDYAFIITTSQILSLSFDLNVVHVNHILTSQQQIKIKMLLEGKDYSWLTGGLSDKIARELAGKKLTETAIKNRVNELLEEELKRGLLTGHNYEFSCSDLMRKSVVVDTCCDWNEAIDLAGEQLVVSKHIDRRYLESIKDNIAQYGQYMYLADNIFLLHTSPMYNLKQSADLTLLKINQFSMLGGKPALVFLLVTAENGQQIKILEQLNLLLTDETAVQNLLNAVDIDKVQEFIRLFV